MNLIHTLRYSRICSRNVQDSNLRTSCEVNALAGRPNRPLWQRSKKVGDFLLCTPRLTVAPLDRLLRRISIADLLTGKIMSPGGFEPPTHALKGHWSTQLIYEPVTCLNIYRNNRLSANFVFLRKCTLSFRVSSTAPPITQVSWCSYIVDLPHLFGNDGIEPPPPACRAGVLTVIQNRRDESFLMKTLPELQEFS